MQPDLEQMLADLKQLVEIESPSTDLSAIAKVMDVVEGWALSLGASIQTLQGGTRVFSFAGPETFNSTTLDSATLKPILVLSHADTVWPHGTLKQMPFYTENNKVYGPGTYDMKAGIVGLFQVLRAYHQEGRWPMGGVQVLLSPDEEIGSDSSRGDIELFAKQSRAALVVEPPVADTHNLKTGRKGTGNFIINLYGIASHAGNKPSEGASAITAAAQAVLEIQALAQPELGTTLSVGLIKGGTAVNVISALCSLEIDLRVSNLAEVDRVEAAIQAWQPTDNRVQVEVLGGLNRPPFEQSPATMGLYETAQKVAQSLGFTLGHEVVGGGSDGNFTAAFIPTLRRVRRPWRRRTRPARTCKARPLAPACSVALSINARNLEQV